MATMQTLGNQEHVLKNPDNSSRFYAPELDLVRFFAFILVFGRHVTTSLGEDRHHQLAAQVVTPLNSTALSTANVSPGLAAIQGAAGSLAFGVCLFFFISSYLITRLLLIEKERTGTVAIRDFYIRRSLRIWPLYFFFILLSIVIMHFTPAFRLSWGRILVASFFVANWATVLHGWVVSPIDLLWSVSVEEQFYLIWPSFAKTGRRGIILISSLMVLISAATLFYLGQHSPVLNETVWANTLVQGLFFAAGAFAGVYLKPENFSFSIPIRALLFSSGFGCWLVASMRFRLLRAISPNSTSLLAGYALVLAGTVLIFLAFAHIKREHLPSPLLYLGRISYGLYIFHVLLLDLSLIIMSKVLTALGIGGHSLILKHSLAALLALGLTIAVASLSYRFLEEPFLKLKERFTLVKSRPI